FGLIGRHLPPPAGVNSPARWGDADGVRDIFPDEAIVSDIVHRHHVFRYCSVEHFLDYFKNYYGPILKAFEALGDDAVQLEQDLRELLTSMNTATDGTLVLPSEYIEVIMKVE
ncbi:MAG: SAM-dependent methyltransferase, partial [Pseudomonadota bacterium]